LHSNHDNKNLITICMHVLEDGRAIGDTDDECKSDTMICQECIDKICSVPVNEVTEDNVPREIHHVCKDCVIEKLKVDLQAHRSSA